MSSQYDPAGCHCGGALWRSRSQQKSRQGEKMSHYTHLSLVSGLAGLVLSAAVPAAEPLNATQLKATFSGKTV
jgi:hypothetical protein